MPISIVKITAEIHASSENIQYQATMKKNCPWRKNSSIQGRGVVSRMRRASI
jgi:hypothetical protein